MLFVWQQQRKLISPSSFSMSVRSFCIGRKCCTVTNTAVRTSKQTASFNTNTKSYGRNFRCISTATENNRLLNSTSCYATNIRFNNNRNGSYTARWTVLPKQQQHSFARRFSSSRDGSKNNDKKEDNDGNDGTPSTIQLLDDSLDTITNNSKIVYESTLGHVVKRLRMVSFMSGVFGSVGVPCIIALKDTMPETGILISAIAFVTGSVATTIVVHYIFLPYVYSIEKVVGAADADSEADSNGTSIGSLTTSYKVLTRNVFLQPTYITFTLPTSVEKTDTGADVITKYDGLRPMCNISINSVPLYVHPEYVYDQTLRNTFQLDSSAIDITSDSKTNTALQKDNPDDFF